MVRLIKAVGALPPLLLLLIANLAISASANAPVLANWPQSRFDVTNSGFNPYETAIGPTNAAHLQQAWVRTDDESSNAAPTVVDNIIYMGCGAAMCAIEAPDQVLKWNSRIPAGTMTYSAAAVSRGMVYAGTNSGWPGYALGASTGTRRERVP